MVLYFIGMIYSFMGVSIETCQHSARGLCPLNGFQPLVQPQLFLWADEVLLGEMTGHWCMAHDGSWHNLLDARVEGQVGRYQGFWSAVHALQVPYC